MDDNKFITLKRLQRVEKLETHRLTFGQVFSIIYWLLFSILLENRFWLANLF